MLFSLPHNKQWLGILGGLPRWLSGKEFACNAGVTGDAGLICGLEDPLDQAWATPSNILAWKISWTEEPGGLQFMGSREPDVA